MSSRSVSIEGIDCLLLAKRGLFWPEQKTLFIADTHFGKEATFRSQGVPVPSGSTEGTLSAIAEMILENRATRLILLGDMFHARSSLADAVRCSLDRFFEKHPKLLFTLVLGNHDRNIRKLPKNWPIEVVDPGTQIGRLCISHFPDSPASGSDLMLCGHIHPAYRFRSTFDSIGKLACFWLSQRVLVLPAIGEFTGTQVVKPSATDRTWVIIENQIMEVGKPDHECYE